MRGESFNKMKAKSDEKYVRKNERFKNEKTLGVFFFNNEVNKMEDS